MFADANGAGALSFAVRLGFELCCSPVIDRSRQT